MTAAALIAVALSAEPSLLRVGQDVRAAVRVSSTEEPRLAASAGRFEALRRDGDGAWVASYVPPQDGPPQLAILTAIADGGVAWLAIPLWAEGDAVVKTRARASIVVRIGDQAFGPVIADAHGQAVVPVVVPPGVQTAYHGKEAIPLHLPLPRTVHVALGAADLGADRAQIVPVYVVAVTAEGAPRSGANLRLRASRGKLSGLKERAPGLYESQLSLSPGRPGEARVTAVLDDARELAAEASLALGGGPAESLSISSGKAEISAEAPQATLRVIARDAAGNAPSEKLRFETTAGDLHAVQSAPGEWDLTLTLSPSFGGRTAVDVRVTSSKRSAFRTFALVPGPPQSAAFESPEATVIADGARAVRLRIALLDRYGNAVSNAEPELSAGEGTASLERTDGAIYASYVPPLLRERGDTVLALRAGPAEARAHLTLLPDLHNAALGAKVGFLSNFSGFSAPLIGLEGAYRTDRFGPELTVLVEADYAHRTYSEMQLVGASSLLAESDVDLLLLHLSAGWRRRFGDLNTFFISGGPAVAAYWTRVTLGNGAPLRGFAAAPGLQGSLGVERRMEGLIPFLEVRAAWITSSGLPILEGPLRTFSFFGGVRLETF